MWTLLATCAMRGDSAYHFLRDALIALINNATPPSLLTLQIDVNGYVRCIIKEFSMLVVAAK